jgi:PIN domain nuclease of toxin-antitoxin system
VLDDPRLSGKARENIIATEGLIFVSPASLWEIAHSTGQNFSI